MVVEVRHGPQLDDDFGYTSEGGVSVLTPPRPEQGAITVYPNPDASPATVVDGAIPPTIEEVRKANAGEYAPRGAQRWIQRMTNNWAVRLGLAGAGSYAAYQTVPAIHEFVDENVLSRFGIEKPVPETFDNKATKGIVGEKNTVALPLSEIQDQFPNQLIEKDNTLTMLWPFITPEGTSVSYEKNASEFLATQELKTEAQNAGVKDNQVFILPKVTTLVAPADMHILVEGGRQEIGENPNMSPRVRMIYHDQESNTTYLLWFSGMNKGVDFEPLVPLQTPDNWSGTKWKSLPKIEQGQALLRNTKDNQPMRLNIKAYKGENIGGVAEIVNKSVRLLTPQFTTSQDSVNSNKVVVLKN